jgi:hypothetical protein
MAKALICFNDIDCETLPFLAMQPIGFHAVPALYYHREASVHRQAFFEVSRR